MRLKKLLVVTSMLFSVTCFSACGADNDNVNSSDITQLVQDASNQLASGELSVKLTKANSEAAEKTALLIYDDPRFFWIGDDYRISSVNKYSYIQFSSVYSDIEAKQKEIDAVADQMINAMPSGLDEYGKVKYIHDSLCERITYEKRQNPGDSNIYGALVEGKTVCEGYAKSFKYLLDKIGIESKIYGGTANNGKETVPHAWNSVKIDGELYYFDVTWDDMEENGISYQYFGVTSSEITRDHTFDENHPVDSTSATVANYYYHEGYVMDEYSDEMFAEIIKKQSDVIDVKCTSIVTFEKLVSVVTSPYNFNTVLSMAGNENSKFDQFSYIVSEETRTVRVFF